MTEQNHMDASAARKVADAIRNNGGVFLGSRDWMEANGIAEDQYEAFFDYAVHYAAELDYKDSKADVLGSLSTKAIVEKFGGDASKVTVSLVIDPHRYGDIASIKRLIGEPMDIVMYPTQMPIPLDEDGQYVPDGVEEMF